MTKQKNVKPKTQKGKIELVPLEPKLQDTVSAENILTANKFDIALGWSKRVAVFALAIGGIICIQYFVANDVPFPLALSSLTSTFAVVGVSSAFVVLYLLCLLFAPTFAQTGGIGKNYPLLFIDSDDKAVTKKKQIWFVVVLYVLPTILFFMSLFMSSGAGILLIAASLLVLALAYRQIRARAIHLEREQIYGALGTLVFVLFFAAMPFFIALVVAWDVWREPDFNPYIVACAVLAVWTPIIVSVSIRHDTKLAKSKIGASEPADFGRRLTSVACLFSIAVAIIPSIAPALGKAALRMAQLGGGIEVIYCFDNAKYPAELNQVRHVSNGCTQPLVTIWRLGEQVYVQLQDDNAKPLGFARSALISERVYSKKKNKTN